MGNACDGNPIASQSLSVQAAHKLKKSVADLCLHISVDGVDADVKFGYEAIRDGWTMLTSDPNIRRRSIKVAPWSSSAGLALRGVRDTEHVLRAPPGERRAACLLAGGRRGAAHTLCLTDSSLWSPRQSPRPQTGSGS